MTSTIEPFKKIPPSKVHFYIKGGVLVPYVEPQVFKELSAPKERACHVRNRPGHVRPLHKRKR
jgi:hypothetical protein